MRMCIPVLLACVLQPAEPDKVQLDADLEEKYGKLYEESVNPFEVFHRKVCTHRLSALTYAHTRLCFRSGTSDTRI